jgi:hypothetical protein
MFDAGSLADPNTVGNFVSDPELTQRAAYLLHDAGFEILQVTALDINIAGAREDFERAFETTLLSEERPTIKELGREEEATFLDCPDSDIAGLIPTAGTRFDEVLEGVGLEEPRYLMQSPFAPTQDYWHLEVPGDISLGCNADRVHRTGITGGGVQVAMVDSGWHRHAYFDQRGYRAGAVTLGPGTSNPLDDEYGHGTGESANLFAVAPDVELLPVKAMLAGTLNTVMVNATAAFNAAVGLGPDIITNSWGFDLQQGPLSAAAQALSAAVAAAVGAGIIVVFSAGNGHWGFPGQHPDVVSAGGVFMDSDGSLTASDYASGFTSNIFAGRRVPDVSGLVGMRPKAQYIMLPVQAGDTLDQQLAGGTHPNGDETTDTDGWAAFSGTSAAAPQVAGVAALVKQACPRLTPAQVKDILMRTARDVTTGTNHPNFGNQATTGPDLATGEGLVNAHRAVLLARVRCLTMPVKPIQPLVPAGPVRPIWPLPPIQPLTPVLPVLPFRPIQPLLPVRPVFPADPLQPLQPLFPIQPVTPFRPPISPIEPGPGPIDSGPTEAPLSEEEAQEVERMIIDSDEDLF